MSKMNVRPLFEQAIAKDGEYCDCPHPMLSRGSTLCDFCGRWNQEAEAKREYHPQNCICADCSGAELTSDND